LIVDQISSNEPNNLFLLMANNHQFTFFHIGFASLSHFSTSYISVDFTEIEFSESKNDRMQEMKVVH